MDIKKKCTKCGEEKTLVNFPKNIKRKDGYADWCKDCVKEYKKANPDKAKKAYETWKGKCEFNPLLAKKQKDAMKKWRKNNPHKIKMYNEKEKEKRKSYKSEYFL